MHPAVVARLAKLAPDQRAAATAPPGPTLCIAPAGSGKTTTLVARIAWLIAAGAAVPDEIVAITFNKRAADELAERLTAALAPLEVPGGAVRVRTFHALGREILADAGLTVEPLVDRMAILRRVAPDRDTAGWHRLDTAFSKLKLDLEVTAEAVAADAEPGPVARAFVAYEAAVRASGGLDFDDLVARALRTLSGRPEVLARWRERAGHLLVDEAQDLDRSQLRLALLLATPANRIFLVGDDDQSIYGWRLADVRRVLSLAADLPRLRRVDLEVNYRCPATVVGRAVRLVEHNRERFAKRVRAAPAASGPILLAADGSDEVVRIGRLLDGWHGADGTLAILARTNRELLPALAVAIDRGRPFRPPPIELLVGLPAVDRILDLVEATPADLPLPARIEAVRRRLAGDAATVSAEPEPRPGAGRQPDADPRVREAVADPDAPSPAQLAAAVLAWSIPHSTLAELRAGITARRSAIAALCRDDAPLSLATAHATKGLEFDHVAVIGMEAGRFPSRRSVQDAEDPIRALEEERRLAYVAWTRARRSLTLVYDPLAPSPFLLEAFSPDELGLAPRPRRRPP